MYATDAPNPAGLPGRHSGAGRSQRNRHEDRREQLCRVAGQQDQRRRTSASHFGSRSHRTGCEARSEHCRRVSRQHADARIGGRSGAGLPGVRHAPGRGRRLPSGADAGAQRAGRDSGRHARADVCIGCGLPVGGDERHRPCPPGEGDCRCRRPPQHATRLGRSDAARSASRSPAPQT